jgi:hypothetical protein
MRWLKGLLGLPSYYTRRPDALSPEAVAAIRDAILASPYMSVNNLNMRFEGTYGFSVVFRRDSLEAVIAQFPAFEPFLRRALRPDCNAFFLNPLLIANGGAVKPHQDFSLSSYAPEARFPEAVSVLYVEVPEGLQGGAFRLYRGDRLLAELPPRARTLLTFQGELRHEVAPVAAGAPDIYEARLSLVVEQYRLTEDQLEGVPTLKIGTRRETAAAGRPLEGGVGDGAFGDALRALLESGPPSV